MAARELAGDEVGLPEFPSPGPARSDVFGFSSHARAREALDFALDVKDSGFNLFVVGEDRSGRMTATLQYLRQRMDGLPPPDDWVYLNNFRRPHRPRPLPMRAGNGRKFRDRMADGVRQLREALSAALGGEAFQSEVRAESEKLQRAVQGELDRLREDARNQGLTLVQTKQGLSIVGQGPDGQPRAIDDYPPEEREPLREAARSLSERLADINRRAARQQMEMGNRVAEIGHGAAVGAIGAVFERLQAEFAGHRGIARWLVEMQNDVLENLELFRADAEPKPGERPEARYAVNLFVDHCDDSHPGVVLEANPTYENLFGRVEYSPIQGGLYTDFTMLRAGAIHRANGGVLVLRAEALARGEPAWEFLKGALRDREVVIEELHRHTGVPLAGAPRPKPIPLDLKVVIIGAPRWYYTFFSTDPELRTYFKVKADIDPDMECTAENLGIYAALIQHIARDHRDMACEEAAVMHLLGMAARWAGHRGRLTARFEVIEDVVTEAVEIARGRGETSVTLAAVKTANANRRRRNARVEDRMQESIREGRILITTEGAVVGQINALTVRDLGDHAFGSPARVTARASVGRLGVVNIERQVSLGGPLQQKGVLVLEGFLSGRFARRFPLSCNCSLTFEQSYGGVEGDSASLAELLCILSDLSRVPLRQDLAITGSVNQRGEAQAIGGAHHKVEGFFRTCQEAGRLDGTHGVVIPKSNDDSLVLRDEVAEAVTAGLFHVWSVADVDDALELFTGMAAGRDDGDGRFPADSVYGRVMAQLEAFDRALYERERRHAR